MQSMRRSAALVISSAVLATAIVAAQGAQGGYTPPRTPWGDPDLQGIWPSTHMVDVPFERPDQFGNRLMLTDAEFKERQAAAAKLQQLALVDVDVANPSADVIALGDLGDGTSPPPHWLERGQPSRQSSLIVDPPNGKAPPMTAEGQARQKLAKTTYIQRTGFDGPDELGPYDRCISRGVVGSMMPVVYNNGNEIVQAPGVVVLRNEMIHEARIIPLDPAGSSGSPRAESRGAGRPGLPATFKSYMGDSRGRWEGDTLVVRTTNLNGANGLQANGQLMLTSDAVEFVERFTRTAPDTIQYEVTITDPKTWTRPWTIAFPLRQDPDYQIFEYACHEGNYSMRNTLSGSRADEKR
jgi:hypothetical protein